jgi:hypothetical protein
MRGMEYMPALEEAEGQSLRDEPLRRVTEGKFPVKVPLREDKTGAHDVIGPRPLPRHFALYFFPRRYSRTLRQTNGTARTKASIRIRLIRIRFADRPTLLASSPRGFGLGTLPGIGSPKPKKTETPSE